MIHQKQHSGERIVVKIGTESLFQWENREFGGEKIKTLCSDISYILHKTSDEVVLVSSWAVGFGTQITGEIKEDIISKQYLASVGQKALMTAYDVYFSKHHIITGQVLATHADIEDDEIRKESVQRVLWFHFMKRTLPIVNENDTISSEEMLIMIVMHFLLLSLLRRTCCILLPTLTGCIETRTSQNLG